MDENGINERIRELFELKTPDNKTYSSSSVSKATGIGRVTLDNYRTGRQKPSAYNVTKIADFFGVRYEWLFAGRGDMYEGDESSGNESASQIPLSVVRMMHEERMKHYEENRILLDEIQKLTQTVQEQMIELKKMNAHQGDNAGCADVG